MKFPQIVYAESFPQTIKWNFRDTFALLLIPIIFINTCIVGKIFPNIIDVSIADSIFRGILFIAICVLYKTMLVEHWKYFNKAKIKSYLLVFTGAIVLQVIISLTKSILPLGEGSQADDVSIDPNSIPFYTLFIVALGPLFMALIEDIIFRYTLLQKLFISNIIFRVVVILLNSILFGLIHYYNFDGNVIATISFMAAGLFLNLIYIWTRNIWHVLLIHFVNNAVLSLGGVILLKVVTELS